jgi:hypothetical protein
MCIALFLIVSERRRVGVGPFAEKKRMLFAFLQLCTKDHTEAGDLLSQLSRLVAFSDVARALLIRVENSF